MELLVLLLLNKKSLRLALSTFLTYKRYQFVSRACIHCVKSTAVANCTKLLEQN